MKTVMLDFAAMTDDQKNLMILLQSSQDKQFIDLLYDAINQADSHRGLTGVLEYLSSKISAARPEEQLDML